MQVRGPPFRVGSAPLDRIFNGRSRSVDQEKFIKPTNWTGSCSDLTSLRGGYGDDGGLQTIDELKNAPKVVPDKPVKKEDNSNEAINASEDIDFNK